MLLGNELGNHTFPNSPSKHYQIAMTHTSLLLETYDVYIVIISYLTYLMNAKVFENVCMFGRNGTGSLEKIIYHPPDSSDLYPKSFGYFLDATRTSSSIIRRRGVISVRGHCLKTKNQTYYLPLKSS